MCKGKTGDVKRFLVVVKNKKTRMRKKKKKKKMEGGGKSGGMIKLGGRRFSNYKNAQGKKNK